MTSQEMPVKLLTDDAIPVNTRVRVIAVEAGPNGDYKSKILIGKLGTIKLKCDSYGKFGIELDDIQNNRSCLGLFYFRPEEIEVVINHDNEEDNMTVSTTNITGYVNAIRVKYIGESNRCSYVFASFEPDLQVGDLVVVKPAHHSISLARVDEILEGTDYETVREVVSKVDTSAYNERVKVRNQVAELKAKMEARARQLQDISLYQLLAKNDSEMQELLAQYQSISNI